MKLIYLLPIIVLVLLALAIAIWWFLSSRKREAELARSEAQAIREEAAATIRPTIAGQQAYAQQAEQRHAEQAREAERVEAERLAAEERAEQAAREAAEAQRRADDAARDAQAAEVRVEAASAAVDEAGHEVRDAHQRVEETRAAYAADLHRADVVDPDTDVTEEDPVSALSADDERAQALAMGEGYQDEVSEEEVVAAGAAVAGPAVTAPAIVEPTIAQPLAVDPTSAHHGAHDDGHLGRQDDTHDGGVGSAVHSDGTMPDDEAVTADAPIPVDEAAVESDVDTELARVEDEPTTEDTWTDADASSDAGSDLDAETDTWVAGDAGDGTDVSDTETGDTAYAEVDEAREDGEATHDEQPAGVMPSDAPETEAWGRRISAMDEVRDGGFGMGSAAPIGDGAQPLGHSVQAYRDTMTFRTEDMPGYDSCEPDVWFYDVGAAERAGFSPAQGG